MAISNDYARTDYRCNGRAICFEKDQAAELIPVVHHKFAKKVRKCSMRQELTVTKN